MEETIARLLELYENAELQLLEIVAKHILAGDELSDEAWVNQKLKNITALRKEVANVILSLPDNEMRKLILQRFLDGGSSVVPDGFIATNQDAVTALINEYTANQRAMHFQILRSTLDDYRNIIANVAQQSTLGIDTRIVTARKALDKFAEKGITGFKDVHGRNIDLRSYTEMSSRTVLNNALREGKLQGVIRSEKDLIIIRAGPNHCPLCDRWQNKIVSISGLDEAKANGLYHPNCKCSFSPYTEGLTKINEGRLQQDKYDESQELRHAERQTRIWKKKLAVADTASDKQKANDKIKEWRNKAKDIAANENLIYKPNRISLIQAR